MTKNQRVALIVMLGGMAIILHVLFFEWSTEWDPTGGSYIFNSLTCVRIESGCLRIWYDNGTFQNGLISVLIGIILPILMICGAVYMYLGIAPAHQTVATSEMNTEKREKSEH